MRKHAFFPLTSKMFSPGAALGPTCVGDCGAVTFADRHRREACEIQPLRRGSGAGWLGSLFVWRMRTGEKPVKSSHYGGFRASYGWYVLIWLPATTERLIEIDERIGGALLRRGVFVLQSVLLALGVHDIQKIGQSAIVALLS